MYQGEACEQPLCPNNCSHPQGKCNREKHHCECSSLFKGNSFSSSEKLKFFNVIVIETFLYLGDDCSQVASKGYWEVVGSMGFMPVGSASHAAVVFKDSMYIIGGESYKRGKMTYIYDFTGNVWETLHMDNKPYPSGRYGHSAVLFGVCTLFVILLFYCCN